MAIRYDNIPPMKNSEYLLAMAKYFKQDKYEEFGAYLNDETGELIICSRWEIPIGATTVEYERAIVLIKCLEVGDD